jgi:hypothetical protein
VIHCLAEYSGSKGVRLHGEFRVGRAPMTMQ